VENITSSKLFTTRQGTVLLGVIAAVIAAIALLVYLNHYRNSVGASITVLVANKLIPQGTPGDVIRTTPGYYVTKTIPQSQAESGAITNPATLSGTVVTATDGIAPSQPLTESDFGTGTPGVAGQLPKGDRAVTVSLESPNQVGGQIAAGSPVDVWVSFNGQGSNGISRPIVRELYQNMKVLTVASSGGNVTLQATPDQAGALIFASENATIYLTLRPPVGSPPDRHPPIISTASLLTGRALRIGR
jgi:Flp pilus assembly protein CpaB